MMLIKLHLVANLDFGLVVPYSIEVEDVYITPSDQDRISPSLPTLTLTT